MPSAWCPTHAEETARNLSQASLQAAAFEASRYIRRQSAVGMLQTGPMSLEIDAPEPLLTPEQSLTGWRREFCVELLGDGRARVFLRALETPSLKATELKRAVLFHRVQSPFSDLAGCVAAARDPLERLAASAVRQQPGKDNLFEAVTYDRRAWEAVEDAVEQWQRRRRPAGARAG